MNSSPMAGGENEKNAMDKIINFAIRYSRLGEFARLMLRSN
jgi:hypothetical protein